MLLCNLKYELVCYKEFQNYEHMFQYTDPIDPKISQN